VFRNDLDTMTSLVITLNKRLIAWDQRDLLLGTGSFLPASKAEARAIGQNAQYAGKKDLNQSRKRQRKDDDDDDDNNDDDDDEEQEEQEDATSVKRTEAFWYRVDQQFADWVSEMGNDWNTPAWKT